MVQRLLLNYIGKLKKYSSVQKWISLRFTSEELSNRFVPWERELTGVSEELKIICSPYCAVSARYVYESHSMKCESILFVTNQIQILFPTRTASLKFTPAIWEVKKHQASHPYHGGWHETQLTSCKWLRKVTICRMSHMKHTNTHTHKNVNKISRVRSADWMSSLSIWFSNG